MGIYMCCLLVTTCCWEREMQPPTCVNLFFLVCLLTLGWWGSYSAFFHPEKSPKPFCARSMFATTWQNRVGWGISPIPEAPRSSAEWKRWKHLWYQEIKLLRHHLYGMTQRPRRKAFSSANQREQIGIAIANGREREKEWAKWEIEDSESKCQIKSLIAKKVIVASAKMCRTAVLQTTRISFVAAAAGETLQLAFIGPWTKT